MTGSSDPSHENCEGTAGIRNRLLRSLGRSFQVIEAPWGLPLGGGANHHNSGIGTSRNYWNCVIFIRNPKISTNCGSPVIGGGQVLSPPNRPCALRCVVLPFWNYRSRWGGQGGGGIGITCRSPKRALRKYYEDFNGSRYNHNICDTQSTTVVHS